MDQNKVVSFDDELLICVDGADNILDYKTKVECHLGEGLLHRAFSIFIFNTQNQVIMQKRSDQKLLWPLFWSNSCCSHPRKGETTDLAAIRRLEEELGIHTELKYLYTFEYQARFKNIGSENELCAVYIGRSDQMIRLNENEIAEWKYIDIDTLSVDVQKHPDNYTPWFRMEWQKLTKEFIDDIHSLSSFG